MRSLLLVPVLVVALPLAGCTDLQSSDLKTAGMSADMTVTADGSGQTSVTAQFHVDDNATDFVVLSSGDTVSAQVAGQTQAMSESNALGDVSYQTAFTGDDGSGMQYVVALTRTTDVSAPSSVVTLPSPFDITAPTSSGSYSRAGSDLVVTYDHTGTGDPTSWLITGSCLNPSSGTVANDAGTFTVARGSLVVGGSENGGTCQATLSLTRSRPGEIDPHYGSGGSIVAQQVRSLTFNSTP